MKKKIAAVAVSAALIAMCGEEAPGHDFVLDELIVPKRNVVLPEQWHARSEDPEPPEPGEPLGYYESALRIGLQTSVVPSIGIAELNAMLARWRM